MSESDTPYRVLIVGGGVAGLEGALALRELARERVQTTLLSPESEFVYRPMRVREPFGLSEARRYPLEELTRDIGVELVTGSLRWIEPDQQYVHTADGTDIPYDALLLAMGARMRPAFAHGVTLDDRHLDEQLHGLIQDVEGGYLESVLFVIPEPMPWPLPAYELALMTARRAYDCDLELAVTIVTPEEEPLALFGALASAAVRKLLSDNRVEVITSAHAAVPSPGRVEIHPQSTVLRADRIVALPQLSGPATPGLQKHTSDGFIPVDPHGRVHGVENVYAAGDATTFPVKFGGIAAQQADAAAEAIAAAAGVDITPKPFHPTVNGILIGAEKPLYLSAQITGGQGSSSTASETPPPGAGEKITAQYLSPFLERRDQLARNAS